MVHLKRCALLQQEQMLAAAGTRQPPTIAFALYPPQAYSRLFRARAQHPIALRKLAPSQLEDFRSHGYVVRGTTNIPTNRFLT